MRYHMLSVAIVALSTSTPGFSQVITDDTALTSEIGSLEARIASLRKLKELREEEARIRSQIEFNDVPASDRTVTSSLVQSVSTEAASAASRASLDKPVPVPSPTAPAPAPTPEPKGGVGDFLAHFSVGAAVLLFDTPLVETAEFTGSDRRVVVTDDRTHSVTPWLQANYVWDAAYDRGYWFSKTTMPGIFAGVGMGPDGSFLDTFGVGAQLSFKRLAPGKSLNLGVGYYFSSKKELADGIVEGQALPTDYDQIKYRRRSAEGLLINLSFGFQ